MDTDKWKQIAEAVWRLADMEKRLGDDSITEDEMVATCDDIMDSMRALASDPERTCGGCCFQSAANDLRCEQDWLLLDTEMACRGRDWQPREGGDDDETGTGSGAHEARPATDHPAGHVTGQAEGGDAPPIDDPDFYQDALGVERNVPDAPDETPDCCGNCRKWERDGGDGHWGYCSTDNDARQRETHWCNAHEPECALAEEMERHLADLHETGRSIDHSALKTGVLGACSYLYELVPKVRTLAADLARVTGEREEANAECRDWVAARSEDQRRHDAEVRRLEDIRDGWIARSKEVSNERNEAVKRAEGHCRRADHYEAVAARRKRKMSDEAEAKVAELEARLGRAVWELPVIRWTMTGDAWTRQDWAKELRCIKDFIDKQTVKLAGIYSEAIDALASAIEAAPEPAKPARIAAPAELVEWLRGYVHAVPDSLDETARNLRSLLALLDPVEATLVTREMWEAWREQYDDLIDHSTYCDCEGCKACHAALGIPEEWVPGQEESDETPDSD